MSYRSTNNNEPVCRFGPGGDYSCYYPTDARPKSDENSITAVLNILAGIIEQSCDLNMFSIEESNDTITVTRKESAYNKEEKSSKNDKLNTFTKTASIAQTDQGLTEQQLLFTDNCGTGVQSENKQKHRVRPHRRASKKEFALDLCSQGSLFDLDRKSA